MTTTPESFQEENRYATTANVYASLFFALAYLTLVAAFVLGFMCPKYFSPMEVLGFVALATAGQLILATAGKPMNSAILLVAVAASAGLLKFCPGVSNVQALAAVVVLVVVGGLGLVIASAKFSLRELVGDGIILLICSSVFVIVCNKAFDGIKKKGSESDTLTTAITQQNLERVKKIFDEKEYASLSKEEKLDSYQAYCRARVGRRDQFGRTPLMWSAYVNFSDAKTSAKEADGKDGQKLSLRDEADGKRLPIVSALISFGAEVNAKDNDGWTPLLWASWSGLPQVVEELVAKGADVSVRDAQGNSALGLAAQRGNVAVVKMLLDKGAKPSEQDRQVLEKAKAEYPRRHAVYEEILGLMAQK